MSSFAMRLKLSRAVLDLTQQELADKSGVNRVTIANLERENSETPRASTVHKLANALEVDPGWLLTGSDEDVGKEAA